MPKNLHWINVPAIATALAILIVWQTVVALKVIDFSSVPLPTEVAEELCSLLGGSAIYTSIWFTLQNSLIAVAIAVGIGVPLGIALARLPLVRSYSLASFDLLRHIPLIALFPVALLVWGPTRQSEIILAAFAAVWPVLMNVMSGVANMPPRLLEVARVMRLSRFDTVRKVLVPAILTSMVVGIRLAIVVAFLVTIVSEMLVSGAGLGWDLVTTQLSLNAPRLWALAVLAGVIGYLLNVVLERSIGRLWPYYAMFETKAVAR